MVDFSSHPQLTVTPITLEVALPSLDESSSYPPAPFLQEEPAPLNLGWFLMVGTILGFLLVFISWQVADSHSPATPHQLVVASGVKTMSATD